MKTTKFIAGLGVTCALIASPAIAQSSATGAADYAKDKAQKTPTPDIPVLTESAPQSPSQDGNGSVPKTQSQKLDKNTSYFFPEGFRPSPDMMTKSPVPSSAPVQPSVPKSLPAPTSAPWSKPAMARSLDCPSGTTAQANGTCLITGDYK